MFSQAFKAIPNLSRFKGHAGFADYLDDLGNLQGFKDLVIGHSSAVSTFVALLATNVANKATNVANKATIRQYMAYDDAYIHPLWSISQSRIGPTSLAS